MDGAIVLSCMPKRISSIATIFSSSSCNNNNNKSNMIRLPLVINQLSYSHRSSSSSSAATTAVASSSTFDDDVTISNHHHHHHRQEIGPGGDATTRASKSTTISKAGSSFSRLKSNKIRSLALKTANKMMKDVNRHDVDITIEEDGMKREGPERQRFNISRSNSTTVSTRESKTRPNRNRSEVAVNREDVGSVSRVSSSSTQLRGWNGGGRGGGGGGERSNRWVRPEYTDRNVKQQSWKVPPAVDNSFFSQKSFREVGCNDNMIEFLKSQHIRRPSHIQALAFVPVLELKSCIIADQSGSGKTLAYLLPVIQRIRQEELEGRSNSLPQSPRVVILVPTAELACQVLSNCRKISKYGVPFRSIVATGGFSQKTQLESLEEKLDVIIATPGRFMFLIKQGLLHLSNLTCAILDEVDILFNDEDYGPALQMLIKSSPVTTQYLFVTATLPTDIYNKLIEVFPDCEMIMGPGMHRTSPGLEEVLVDCSGDEGTAKTPDTAFDNKRSALLKLVKEIRVAKTIVFCNKIETCRKVENVLKRVDRKSVHVKVLPFHSALAKESQLANMEEFCSTHQLDTSLFLVCTDRASRGIDFDRVDHVVLFDYPRDPSEYVRRVGRTARGAGGKGKAYIFVVGKQVSLARRVIERNIKGHPLHDLPTSANFNFDWGV